MKKRLRMLTSQNFSPFYVLLEHPPIYNQTKGGSAGFSKEASVSGISQKSTSLFIKTARFFLPGSQFQHTSETTARPTIKTHYVVKLNV